MNPKDHEKISPEAHQMFERLLVEYYKMTYEESYQLLRGKIKKIFLSKDTNSRYRIILLADLEDLTLSVILRLMDVNLRWVKETGRGIRDLELVLNRVAGFVYKEELKAIRKSLNAQPIEGDDSAGRTPQIPQPINDEIQALQNQIRRECYAACVEKLPARIRAVFRAYYPNVSLSTEELVAARRRLADEVAGLTQAQARSRTPEQEARTLNNLQSKVNKWRKSHVEECVRECVEAKQSRHARLNYLAEQ